MGENQAYIGARIYDPYHLSCFYPNCDEFTVRENWTKNMAKDVVPVGGEDRRGANFQIMIDLVTLICDYVVVKSYDNKDGIFTKICADNKIPLTEIKKTKKVGDIFKVVFILPA